MKALLFLGKKDKCYASGILKLCKNHFARKWRSEMHKYNTVIIHLESLVKHNSNESIRFFIDRLKLEQYILCLISSEEIVSTHSFSSEEFAITKTCKVESDFGKLIKQILGETNSSSAVIIGCNEDLYRAANETRCLSIGKDIFNIPPDFRFEDDRNVDQIMNKINTVFSSIRSTVFNNKNADRPFIVGVNGVDTSGKTEFASELRRYLVKQGFHTEIIRIDDFHNESKIRYSKSDPVISYYDCAFDLSKLESDILYPLKTHGKLEVELVHLDLNSDRYTKKKSYCIKENSIVLIEGVLLYREPIRKYLDLKIYLDISFDEVLRRAQIRDSKIFGNELLNKYISKYIPVQKKYLQLENPKNTCDILINNENFSNPIILKKPTMEIDDKKLRLVPVAEKHLIDLHEVQSDPEAVLMLGVIDNPRLSDYEYSKSYIITNESDKVIGQVELFNISWRNRRAELSIGIKKQYRNQGYGAVAIRKILKIGFLELGLYRIWLRVLEVNKPAISLYEKMGFTREGVCRSESLREGQFLDQIQMSVLLPEWNKLL